jgi:hypothetical protein
MLKLSYRNLSRTTSVVTDVRQRCFHGGHSIYLSRITPYWGTVTCGERKRERERERERERFMVSFLSIRDILRAVNIYRTLARKQLRVSGEQIRYKISNFARSQRLIANWNWRDRNQVKLIALRFSSSSNESTCTVAWLNDSWFCINLVWSRVCFGAISQRVYHQKIQLTKIDPYYYRNSFNLSLTTFELANARGSNEFKTTDCWFKGKNLLEDLKNLKFLHRARRIVTYTLPILSERVRLRARRRRILLENALHEKCIGRARLPRRGSSALPSRPSFCPPSSCECRIPLGGYPIAEKGV